MSELYFFVRSCNRLHGSRPTEGVATMIHPPAWLLLDLHRQPTARPVDDARRATEPSRRRWLLRARRARDDHVMRP